MTGVETLFVFSLGMALLAMVAERAKVGKWTESLTTLAIFGLGITGLVISQPFIAPVMDSLRAFIGGGLAATYFVVVVGLFSCGVAWFLLNRFFAGESRLRKVFIFMAVALGGTTAGILYFRPGFGGPYYIYYLEILGLEAGLIMFVGAVIYWRHGPQNILANPIALVALVAMVNWLQYIIYRVNPLADLFAGNDPAWWGAAAVSLVCVLVMSFIWDKGEEWCRRMSYKILWPCICLTLVVGMFYLVTQMLGWTNRKEAEIKGLRNQVQTRLLDARLGKIWDDRALTAAQTVANDPAATLDQLEKAAALVDAATGEAEKTVADAPSKKPTWNEKKVDDAASGLWGGVKSGASAVVSTAKSLNPFGGGSGGGSQLNGEPLETLNLPGQIYIKRLGPNQKSGWLNIPPRYGVSFSSASPVPSVDPKKLIYSLEYKNGITVRMDKPNKPFPPGAVGPFRIVMGPYEMEVFMALDEKRGS